MQRFYDDYTDNAHLANDTFLGILSTLSATSSLTTPTSLSTFSNVKSLTVHFWHLRKTGQGLTNDHPSGHENASQN